ncbi:hypothetical protein BWD13_03005 [Leptospira santarosai serovar Grippotyphosa]|nr:hypothetical protein LEP1GSC076_1957 [Leptospira sp. Fiocruz LV4135]ONF88192.1 hypothetical protein BWD13_03005 [Leptospira santarosai serovar Grippotyphosa]
MSRSIPIDKVETLSVFRTDGIFFTIKKRIRGREEPISNLKRREFLPQELQKISLPKKNNDGC